MKIRYVLLVVLVVGLAIYAGCDLIREKPKPQPVTPVVEMVAQPEAPEAIAEVDMENVSPEDAEKDQ